MSQLRAIRDNVETLCTQLAGEEGKHASSKLEYALRLLGSKLAVPTRAYDEFSSIQQMQRHACHDPDTADHEKRCRRIEELWLKLKSPACADSLSKRWALLYLISQLAGSGREEDTLAPELLTVPELPHPELLRGKKRGGQEGKGVTGQDPSQGTQSKNNVQEWQRRTPSTPACKATEEGLEQEVEDSELIRDCLYVFQGINGQHIRYDPHFSRHYLHPSLSLSLPPFKRDVLLHLSEMGWLYRRIAAFADRGNHVQNMGLVGQAISFVLKEELTEYFRLIVVLEGQVGEGARDGGGGEGIGGLTLRRLALWVQDPMVRLRLVAMLCDK